MIKCLGKSRKFFKSLNLNFSSDNENKSTHIFISNDQITENAKQVSRIPLRKEISLFTEDYFKERGDHMRIKNPGLETKPNANMITGLGKGSIEINGTIFNTPVIVTSNMVYVWEVDDVKNLTPDHFAILEYMIPEYKYAVITLGEEKVNLPNSVVKYLATLEQKVDNVDWFLASSAFNNCMENDVEAVGFFYV